MGHEPASEAAPRGLRRARTDRGSALVEAAVIAPVMFMLLFAVIDFGSVYNQKLSIHQATAETAREAAVNTQPSPGGAGTWADVCKTTGIERSGDAFYLICFAKQHMGLDQTVARVSVEYTEPWTRGESVIVCTQYPASSVSGYFTSLLSGITLTSKVAIRIEQPSPGGSIDVVGPQQETPLPGTTWPDSCSHG